MFNTYRDDMKYLLIPFIILLFACEDSNTPSPLKTDKIAIEMGGKYNDQQTEKGKAWISTGDDGKDFTYKVFDSGCHTEYAEEKTFTDFILAEDSEWYYINDIDFRIKKNPENNRSYYGLSYQELDSGWELTDGLTTIEYNKSDKTLYYYFVNGANIKTWTYSW